MEERGYFCANLSVTVRASLVFLQLLADTGDRRGGLCAFKGRWRRTENRGDRKVNK